MPGIASGNGPSYISAHSADVILSDIRPVKLKAEGLVAINALLDEFLHIILTTSRSLTTEKLRSSLLSILPTSLGKEALLEAEVELRAYWERTESRAAPEDDSRIFHLQWSFELLRLKCSAYSTLNEDDEDPAAEARVNAVFSKANSYPPQVALLDPAALYLTAILESTCEHILSNVGRVAARDSSRTFATTDDIFVALCEDDSIYGFFKSMRVYEHIESMSETPKHWSKSISQHNRSLSRTSSPHTELSLSSRSRQSSEGQPTSIMTTLGGSRTSHEKQGMKDAQKGHRRTDSVKSDISRIGDGGNSAEGGALQREFDDLMRSASTMKMSLTPDRLKTMEAFKQEKDQKSFGRRPDVPSPTKHLSAKLTRKNSVGRPDKEDDQKAKNRSRQGSITSPSISAFQGIVPTRLRSLSTSGGSWGKPTRTPSVKVTPKAFPPLSDNPTDMPPGFIENNGYPQRTRAKGRKRESLDLDDIMNGSDEEPDVGSIVSQSPTNRSSTPKRPIHIPHNVSPSTRDLMEFLAEGPPQTPGLSKAGRELVEFLAEGPPDYASSTVSLDKSKGGSNRLQKMMSKLSIGNAEKVRTGSDVSRTPSHVNLNSKGSNSTLSSLANKPILPRPPRAPNAPSTFPACDVSDENKVAAKQAQEPVSRDPSSVELLANVPSKTSLPLVPPPPLSSATQPVERVATPPRSPPSAFVHTNGIGNGSVSHTTPPPRTTSRFPNKGAPASVPKPPPSIVEPDVHDMQRLLMNATTVDECRLILGMFMARSGMSSALKPQDMVDNRPTHLEYTPSPSLEASLETSLVELLLGNSTSYDLVVS